MRLQILLITFGFNLILTSTANAFDKGSVFIYDPASGSRSITYEIRGEYAITEDDIIISRISTLSKKSASIISRVGGKLWIKGIMPYEIDENLPTLNRLAVYQAIQHITEKSNIRFIELNAENRKNFVDYVRFVPGEGTTCSSFVGRQRGPQAIELAPRCNVMNTVHEIGHALGLWHEQSRGDRDYYVRILWENIQDDHRFNFEQHLNTSEDFGEYDYSSIMHYPATAFSKNGKKTIIPLKRDIEIGQRNSLSEKDTLALNAMYPLESHN